MVFILALPSQTYADAVIYTDPQLITDVITLLRTTATPKKLCVLPPDGSSFLTLEFPLAGAGFPLQGSQGIC